MENEIFISYTHEDKQIAEQVACVIQNVVKKVTWYDVDLLGGDNYRKIIPEQIKRNEYFLLLLSCNYIKSAWCIDELQYAKEKERIIIPIYIDNISSYDLPVDVEFIIHNKNYISYNLLSKECFIDKLKETFDKKEVIEKKKTGIFKRDDYNGEQFLQIGEDYNEIENEALKGTGIVELEIGPSVKKFGKNIWSNCKDLRKIKVFNYEVIYTDDFVNCDRLEEVEFPNCKYVRKGAFASHKYLKYVDLKKCYQIGEGAFAYCRNLESIDFPECEYMWDYALYGCENLKEARLNGCWQLGEAVFEQCVQLKEVSLLSCKKIENSTFRNCKMLEKVSAP